MTWKLDDPRARRARGRCAKSQEVLEAMKERAAKLSELEAGRKRRAPVKHLQMDVEPAKLKHRKQTAGCQLCSHPGPWECRVVFFVSLNSFFLLLL